MERKPSAELLPELFKTRERVTMLETALTRPSCTVQEISNATGITKGLASRYLSFLAVEGILKREGRKYRAVPGALTRQIKVLLNIARARTILDLPDWGSGIGLYGSWADGTNTDQSDLDVWITTGSIPPQMEIASLERKWKKKCSCDLHLLILTPEKIRALKTKDQPFFSAFASAAITLEGAGYDSSG